MDEFDIIASLFAPLATSVGSDLLRDDVAEIITSGRTIVTADAIVEGVHFLSSDPIETVAAKLVRVNVSDVVAKGGRPTAAVLSLIWPETRRLRGAEELPRFADALGAELRRWGAQLVGGDTTSTPGPLTLSLTLLGCCGPRGPVRRSGASAGDDVWVTGAIGDGWLGLEVALGRLSEISAEDAAALLGRYRTPEPPALAFAGVIAEFATGSVDVSDGLAADAGRLAVASNVALEFDLSAIPLSDEAERAEKRAPLKVSLERLIAGGDDYQALFTAPPCHREELAARASGLGIRLSRIGTARAVSNDAAPSVRFLNEKGETLALARSGWRHFGDDGL